MTSFVDDKKEYEEIQVTLRLKKNVVEVARIFAKCYYHDGPSKDDFDKFIGEQVTNIVFVLAAAPPTLPEFPDSLKQHIQNILKEDGSKT